MRQSKFDGQVNEMVSLYEAGESLKSIGVKFGANSQTVRRLIASTGVVVRPRGRPRTSEKAVVSNTLFPTDGSVTTDEVVSPQRVVSF